ncbi:RHS repeat-associated core domain-containing protein [Pseudomonas anatoliensis]|uniref:RHS repeat-associated core domain-containing protein n=1 Tax=Pseudomonas anatoliensis TaxID=2710589 RepID=UPI001E41EE1D|nr:RHS repeat-associated core domain-containing protein [Pseudomonas anatoliensis]
MLTVHSVLGGATMHAKTPTVSVRDPRGLDIASVSYCREVPGAEAQPRIYRQTYDAAGRPTVSLDPRLHELLKTEPDARPNLQTIHGLTGVALRSDSVDAGSRLILPGLAKETVVGWDSLLTEVRIEYDLMLRPVKRIELAHGGPARNSAFYTYGDNAAPFASHNQCGRVVRIDDSAGSILFSSYALTGGVASQTRYFLETLDEPHWPVAEAERDLLHEPGSGAITRTAFNAIGNTLCVEDAKGNVQFSDLNVAGQLSSVRLQQAGDSNAAPLLHGIQYSAGNQILRQTAGNGVTSENLYDTRDGRLLEIRAGLPGQPPLQRLLYQYDQVGNILRIEDTAQRTYYFRNQRIEPVSEFTYNSLYQLIEATGRQRINTRNGPHEPVFTSPSDPGQLENYRQTYTYDAGGNLTLLIHGAASQGWTQRMAISRYSNRGLTQKDDGSLPDESEIAAGFDACGKQHQLLAGQNLSWSLDQRLRQVDQVVRKEAANDFERYIYDVAGQRQRKIRLIHNGVTTRTHETRYLPGLEIRTTPQETLEVICVQAGRCSVQVLHWTHGGPGADQFHYSLSNHLGSSQLTLDKDAALISEEEYFPYGGTSWWAGQDKVQASYKTRRYSGQERDATGLYYYGQRYYAHWWMRWLSPDPAGIGDGLNLFAMVRGNPVRFVDLQGLAGSDTVKAAAATAGRELPSALLAAGAQYTVTGTLSPLGAGVTIAGAIAGGITGAISGYASTNWAQSRLSFDDPGSMAPFLAKVGGTVLGAALGAAPSLLGALDPLGNTAAAAQIGSAFGTVFRELSSQFLANAGPSNPSVGRADFSTGAASMGAVGAAGGALGYAGSLLFGAEPAGQALQSTLVAATATAVGAAGASAARGLLGTPTKPSKGSGPTLDKAKAVVGYSSRHFFSSLGQLANLAVAQIPGFDKLDANAQAAVSRAVANGIGDLRSTFVTTATPGLSADLGQTRWDVENNTVGSGIEQEEVPTSSNQAYDPAATEVFYIVSETAPGQRKYSRSNLHF